MVQLLGYDSRRHLPDLTTDLAPQRGVYGAELNRHDDVERTSPVLGTGAAMH